MSIYAMGREWECDEDEKNIECANFEKCGNFIEQFEVEENGGLCNGCFDEYLLDKIDDHDNFTKTTRQI